MADDRYQRDYWRGVLLDRYTIYNLEQAERISGIRIEPTQGSYNPGGVIESAGTHDGGGAVDIKVRHLSRAQAEVLCKAMRQRMFAAWIRETIPGVWQIHLHAILMGNTKVSRGAYNQLVAYKNGRNGLANNAVDNFWRPNPIVNASYRTDEKPGGLEVLEDNEANYQIFMGWLYRALRWDVRTRGAGPDWQLGPTIWEHITNESASTRAAIAGLDLPGSGSGDISAEEFAEAVANALPGNMAEEVLKLLADRIGGTNS